MLSFCLLALATLTSAAPIRSGGSTLQDIVDEGEFICVGTIDDRMTVEFPDGIATPDDAPPRRSPRMQFARIRIERVLKGDPATRVVWTETWRDNPCDTSTYETGERAIFMLRRGAIADKKPEVRAVAEKALNSKLIYHTGFSGGGRLHIYDEGRGEFVYGEPAPLSARMYGRSGTLRLDAALDYIEGLAQFAPELICLRAQYQWGTCQNFELRVRPDGRRRFVGSHMWFERVTVDQVTSEEWVVLRERIARFVGDADQRVGTSRESWTRHLTLRENGKCFEAWISDPLEVAKVEVSQRKVFARALRGWGLAHDALECTDCCDDRGNDAEIIAQLER